MKDQTADYYWDSAKGIVTYQTEDRFGKNISYKTDTIDRIFKLYSNFDGNPHTIKQISQKTSIPSERIKFILGVHEFSHDSLPLTVEAEEQTVDQIVEDLMVSKEQSVKDRFEKAEFDKIKADADSWRAFKFNRLDPVQNFISSYKPQKYIPVKSSAKSSVNNGKTLVIGASDWHYGLFAEQRYLYNQKEWNIEATKKAVETYLYKLQSHIQSHQYEKIDLCFLGDLIHTLNGFTDKGTKLEAHPIAEELLEQAYASVQNFVEGLLAVHNNIEVFACSGNHSALGDYVLIKMLEIYFRQEKRIKFNVTNQRNILFKVYDNLFLAEHGYSAVSKNRLPAQGASRENYINNLFLAKPDLLIDTKRRFYLSADQHHHETYELTNVEGFMFPTLVGGCRHSDNSGYKSRPRQTSLSVTSEGITDIHHFYLD